MRIEDQLPLAGEDLFGLGQEVKKAPLFVWIKAVDHLGNPIVGAEFEVSDASGDNVISTGANQTGKNGELILLLNEAAAEALAKAGKKAIIKPYHLEVMRAMARKQAWTPEEVTLFNPTSPSRDQLVFTLSAPKAVEADAGLYVGIMAGLLVVGLVAYNIISQIPAAGPIPGLGATRRRCRH